MSWLALALALGAGRPAPSPVPAWRLVDTQDVHVGVRPALLASPGELGAGLTVQVTLR